MDYWIDILSDARGIKADFGEQCTLTDELKARRDSRERSGEYQER